MMKKILFAVFVLLLIFISYALFTAKINNKETMKQEFDNVYVPKGWTIIRTKAEAGMLKYNIYTKNLPKMIVLFKKSFEFGEEPIRNLIMNLKINMFNLNGYKSNTPKQLGTKIKTIRYISQNHTMFYMVDVVRKELSNSDVLIVYAKTSSNKDEPIDADVKEFIERFDKEIPIK